MKYLYILLVSTIISMPTFGQNFSLPLSEVFRTCDFIHDDEYSLSGLSATIKSFIEAKSEGSKACNASFNQLHSSLSSIDRLIEQNLSPEKARDIFNETYSSYLVNLAQEASTLDPSSVRYNFVLRQIDSLQDQLYNSRYSSRLNKSIYDEEISSEFKKEIFSYSKTLFAALNDAPDLCIGELGGWNQLLPAVLKVSSLVGGSTGPGASVVAAGLESASQLAILFQNKNLKSSLVALNSRKNEAVLSCAYASMQTTACDLSRAVKFVQNKDKIKEIILRDFKNSKFKEYEEYYAMLDSLPVIERILQSIGEMGSAITIDVGVITSYFTSIRIRPSEIVFPPAGASEAVLTRFFSDLENRGVQISETDFSGNRRTFEDRLEEARLTVDNAISTIEFVTELLSERRSFVDLQSELNVLSRNTASEINQFKEFLESYREDSEFPERYKATFAAVDEMIQVLDEFLNVTLDGRPYEDFTAEVNEKGSLMFQSMARGSVAQVNSQTVLMIPGIAFDRFRRPFQALENYFLQRDLEMKGKAKYVSFADYMLNESLQTKVVNDYRILSSSKLVGRLEQYETLKNSFHKSFGKEISKMITYAMEANSDVLGDLRGKTAAHYCALYAPYLKNKRNSSKRRSLYSKCRKAYKELDLLSVLDDFGRETTMQIDYSNTCFYSDYKREENAQRILFNRLLDYGVN